LLPVSYFLFLIGGKCNSFNRGFNKRLSADNRRKKTGFDKYVPEQSLCCTFGFHHTKQQMNSTTAALTTLFEKIPRRHSADNVKEINGILTEYEDLLKDIEGENAWYEKNTAVFFDDLDVVRSAIKKSTDNKASKKNKDNFFDEASGALKDSIQSLLEVYADGNRTA
jgi:hypothetical protein